MVKKILLPTDGSKASWKAATFGVDLACQLKASIVALCVIDKRLFMGQNVPASKAPRHVEESVEDYLREVANSCIANIMSLCEEKGVSAVQAVRTGYPVEEIIKEARKSKVHLIVMGSRGRSALSATVLGSVSYGILHQDKSVPVLIVRD